MKRVVFRGPCLTQSGYGTHSRQICNWLLSRDDFNVSFQPTVWGGTPWIVNGGNHSELIEKIYNQAVSMNDNNFDISFQCQLPNEWTNLAKFNVGITAAIETDRCNPKWTEACNNMDAIIVPSEHSKNSLNPSMIKKPLIVIPEAYFNECTFDSSKLPQLQKFSTDFNFLVFGQLTGNNPFNDRKNTFFTLKWLFEEFQNDANVGIVLKTNTGRNTIIDKNHVVEIINGVIKEARKGPYPRVHLVHGDMNDAEVAALYKHEQVKALVAATRGEGFGLPILEATVSELPVIATPWSGHMDFLKKGKFIQLYHQVTDVHESRIDNELFIAGSRWAEVSEQDFKQKVRKFYKSHDIPKQWAKDLSKILINDYSLSAISEKYNDAVKGLEL